MNSHDPVTELVSIQLYLEEITPILQKAISPKNNISYAQS